LTKARPTRPSSARRKRRWPHDRRQLGRATPSRCSDKIETPAFSNSRQESN
jgi:hypothetical protein